MISLPFNEAPIRESGKCNAQHTPRATAYTFNEAPIRESGKYSAWHSFKVLNVFLQ